ncbi:hypothetical protein BH23GEM9_BH23GEM9_26230 [soil metagenome]
MDHHGFMIGMLWGGALVASVPTLLVIGIGVYVVRQHRAQRASSDLPQPPSEGSP